MAIITISDAANKQVKKLSKYNKEYFNYFYEGIVNDSIESYRKTGTKYVFREGTLEITTKKVKEEYTILDVSVGVEYPEPLDLKLDGNYIVNCLSLETHEMPYHKGVNTSISTVVEKTITEGNDENATEIKIKLKPEFYNITYNELMKLSEWFKQAAKFKMFVEQGQHRFDPNN